MIYKKHELSLSLNGEDIMHIARNAAGVVVFREHSEKALKRVIDEAIREQEYQEQLALEKKLERAKKNKHQEVLEEEPTVHEETYQQEEVLVPASSQKRVTRGPDGKFISKSQLDLEQEDKKKSFWDKLTTS